MAKFTKKKNRKGSKYIGVYKDKIKKMFYFKNTIESETYVSPLFENEDDAAKKYDEYIKTNDSRCKALNFPPKPDVPTETTNPNIQIEKVKKTKKNAPKHKNMRFQKNNSKRPKIPEYIKLIIYSKQENKCNLCRNNLDTCRILDHIMPRYLGGYDNINNYQAICGTCNKWKTYSFDNYIKQNMTNTNTITLDSIIAIQRAKFDKFNGPYID